MTTVNKVKLREFSDRLGLGENHVARDILQARLLAAIFSQEVGRDILLKGGLAMRAAYASRRFTKDIDLQANPKMSTKRVAGVVRTAIEKVLATGLLDNASITAPKQTETVQRWKINGSVGDTPVNMTVEVSRRGMPPAEQTTSVQYAPDDLCGVKPVLIESYSPAAIAAGKVAALTAANRVAPRDIFDLDVLITMQIEPPTALLAQIGADGLKHSLEILWDKLDGMTYELAREELFEYLPREVAERFDKGAWDDMVIRTGEVVEGWLREAIAKAEAEPKVELAP